MQITIHYHPNHERAEEIREAISDSNHLQTHFRFRPTLNRKLPNGVDRVEHSDIREVLVRNKHRPPIIAVLQNPLADNYFAHPDRKISVVTTAGWDERYAPPPLKAFLACEFALACLCSAARLSESNAEKIAHKQRTIGCLFDHCGKDKHDVQVGLLAARICGDCKNYLIRMGAQKEALDAAHKVLELGRGFAIERPCKVPKRIFIGHGRSQVWRQLEDSLEEHGFEIEEFNHQAAAGLAIPERLDQMLGESCLAFLLLTAEDERADRGVQARQNVVHELGLFQGRLGRNKAIILREEGCATFTNIDGITCIEFPKGRLDRAAKIEIRRVLERENLIW